MDRSYRMILKINTTGTLEQVLQNVDVTDLAVDADGNLVFVEWSGTVSRLDSTGKRA